MGVEEIKNRAVVAVIRGATLQTIVPIAEALKNGGVTALEITMETPNALSIIEKVGNEFGDEVLVGAGTVLDPATARAAILAGSKFIFSPIVNNETIKMTKRYGIISVPGAFTPTEIQTAFENGADLVKLFPAGCLGPDYLKNISGPLPHIPLMPTGGIHLENVKEFFKAGAVAVGIGSTLINPNREITAEYLAEVQLNAKKFIEAANSSRIS
ncbi:bifunctional 4-hydroxy-2-oxoglutarate aldolase/2-dehydro-3-deoxy-phosphogluconate aldolase [Bacillus salipaludis]|uniref:bifunctional 4-hydroxy-2-oxoglutarate aldolase/2-dehydro-3-deoxy-phosphogluconate aldolase n=1 Tax=Bacillus salipaludis TaxID=2547811 RepID=UPI003D1E110C